MNAISSLRINRWMVTITSLFDQSGDNAYWFSQTPTNASKLLKPLGS